MTHLTSLSEKNRSTSGQHFRAQNLSEVIADHLLRERVSFHVPGHKRRGENPAQLKFDITETGELDDLSFPVGVLKVLEDRIAALCGARFSVISTGGASAAMVAAILSLGKAGSPVLIPRHAHRSVIHGVILAGLEPVFYQCPIDRSGFGVVCGIDLAALEAEMVRTRPGVLLVVSPTYEGLVSPVAAIAAVCKAHGVALVVDEAHGAHQLPSPALINGAEIVVQSWHKTLGAMTQTGVLLGGEGCVLDQEDVRRCLRLLVSSSPSYVFLASIDSVVCELESSKESLAAACELALWLRAELVARGFGVFDPDGGFDPLHVLINHTGSGADELKRFLEERGIFSEGVFGEGVLLILGTGSTKDDCRELLAALESYSSGSRSETPAVRNASSGAPVMVMNPRQAFFAAAEYVEAHRSAGRIAADCFAPCPPGTCVMVPGQLVTPEIAAQLEPEMMVRVVVESKGDT